jgi:hypothetical protein
MPWTVVGALEQARQQAREPGNRLPGACQETLAGIIEQTGAMLRRRNSEDMAAVSALLTDRRYCVPCLSIMTELDARRVYAAIERLKATANARLVSGCCERCRRETTVHTLGE